MSPIPLELLPNQSILIGLTYLNDQEEVVKQEQVLGSIISVDLKDDSFPTIELLASDGETWFLPLHLPSLMLAPRGEYILRSNGEKVVDPDLIATWTIYSPADQNQPGGWEPNYAPFNNYSVPLHWDHTYRNDEAYLRQTIAMYGQDYLGKRVLVGISYYQKKGDAQELVKREQFLGKIIQVNYSKGINLELKNGEEYCLPPDITMLEPAEPMEYHLKSTGEVVINPDYLSVWTVTIPSDKQSK
jgi:hypothetical protein